MSPKKKRNGATPADAKTATRNTSISLPDDLWQEVKQRADQEERSVSGYVTRLIRAALDSATTVVG